MLHAFSPVNLYGHNPFASFIFLITVALEHNLWTSNVCIAENIGTGATGRPKVEMRFLEGVVLPLAEDALSPSSLLEELTQLSGERAQKLRSNSQ